MCDIGQVGDYWPVAIAWSISPHGYGSLNRFLVNDVVVPGEISLICLGMIYAPHDHIAGEFLDAHCRIFHKRRQYLTSDSSNTREHTHCIRWLEGWREGI